MTPLETYLAELMAIRATGAGVKETSYYPALANLLNSLGEQLRPKVRCVLTLANRGAGLPDGGLFTPDQFQKLEGGAEPLPGGLPARGVIEVKSTGDDAFVIAQGEQVTRYWGHYRQVLVTNYRDFVLVGEDAGSHAARLECYRLAKSEKDFWAQAAHPRKMAEAHATRFIEFLRRVLLRPVPIATPRDLAWFLGSYARDARARIEAVKLPALQSFREALEQALGLTFQDEKGDWFFRSSLIQTLFYGIFSAWVFWCDEPGRRKSDRFSWKTADWSLHVPMVRALFEHVATPSRLAPLGLVEVLDWTEEVLARVDRQAFFQEFRRDLAVQYFYEPFLEAFDPRLRKELGVWYTPPEVVRYMVARVDAVLRSELGIAEGLAAEHVFVLDPCCGTGAYLVEVLRRIARTHEEQGPDATGLQPVKRAAQTRVLGFEIMPAPFVVAHLQLGLLLRQLGVPLQEEERVGVYLTNALVGWTWSERASEGSPQLNLFPEFLAELDAASRVKTEAPILVILGNPPYNAFAGVSPQEEGGLVDPYKHRLQADWGVRKFNLDDLYVRFFRLAERRIVEESGQGVVCFISNFSYLGDPSFVAMRRRFLDGFDSFWFDCLNGDSRETGKITPDGRPDPSVFSTEYNREGITVGTAVGLMVRRPQRTGQQSVRFRHFWGASKRQELLASLDAAESDPGYQPVRPSAENRWAFRPDGTSEEYRRWPRIVDLCAVMPSNGLMEKRGGALIDIDRPALVARMQAYFDAQVEWEDLATLETGLTKDAAAFDARRARDAVLQAESFDSARIRRFAARPLDGLWCYYSAIGSLWNRPRPALWAQAWPGNRFLVTRMNAERPGEQHPIYMTTALPDDHLLRPNIGAIPLRLRREAPPLQTETSSQQSLLQHLEMPPTTPAAETTIANLSPLVRAYLASLGLPDPDDDEHAATLLWHHALAVGYSPAYLAEHADGIRSDWPRIPLPADRDALEATAALGRRIADLLDPDVPVPGVAGPGPVRPDLRLVACPTRVGGGQLKPPDEYRVTVGWGHAGKGGVTMPGRGRHAPRAYTEAERAALAQGSAALGLSLEEALACLGETTADVYLNGVAYLANVPERVWGYTIGGHQVVKKWLSYREQELLGRPLTDQEVRDLRDIIRRLAALLLLEPALDASYRDVVAATYAWQGRCGTSGTV